MPRHAAAHLRLVSNAHVARFFSDDPDPDTAQALLREANARAPAGAPLVPGRRPLWIFGASTITVAAVAHFAAMGQTVAGILDDDGASDSGGRLCAGLPVIPPEAVPQELRAQALVAVAQKDTPFTPVEAELNRQGWTHCVPLDDITEHFRERIPFGSGWFSPRLGAEELDAAGAVLAGFADAASRAHYLRFAAWRLARQEWDFQGAPVEPVSRFFIPEITGALGPGERVLDAGAFHGAALARLLGVTKGAVSTLWAVEPDPANRSVLQARVDRLDLELRARIQILNAVLGAQAQAVRFHSGFGAASCIAPSGQMLRAASPLDALGLNPTLVLLDLEGAELDTLRGARQTLLRHRPIIAVAAHHDAAGLIETPSWLMRELPDYTMLMRTHGWCGAGAVLYAIPQERSAP